MQLLTMEVKSSSSWYEKLKKETNFKKLLHDGDTDGLVTGHTLVKLPECNYAKVSLLPERE